MATVQLLRTTDILRMENLWCVKNLTKLQLDNNIIEKIEGLEALTNLVWLGKMLVYEGLPQITCAQIYHLTTLR